MICDPNRSPRGSDLSNAMLATSRRRLARALLDCLEKCWQIEDIQGVKRATRRKRNSG